MNFNSFLERNQSEIQEFRKDKNPQVFVMSKAERKKESSANPELLEKYEELKSKFRNHKEDWTIEEIETVYLSLDGISRKDLVNMVLNLAINLGRTKTAVRWMQSHIFSEKKDLHRGNQVIQFRKEVGLDKEVENVVA